MCLLKIGENIVYRIYSSYNPKLKFKAIFSLQLNSQKIYSIVFLREGEKDIHPTDTYFSGPLNYCYITFLLQRKSVIQKVYAFPVNHFGDLNPSGLAQKATIFTKLLNKWRSY